MISMYLNRDLVMLTTVWPTSAGELKDPFEIDLNVTKYRSIYQGAKTIPPPPKKKKKKKKEKIPPIIARFFFIHVRSRFYIKI